MIKQLLPRRVKDAALKQFHPLTSIAIEPTNRCNEDCSYCHRKLRPQGDMPLSLYLKTLDQIPQQTLLALSYGGESIVHPDFKSMVDLAVDHGFKPIVFSNGLAPYPRNIKVIVYPKPPPIIFTHNQRFVDRGLVKTLKPSNPFCRDLYRYMGVLWNGDIVPCCHCVAGNRVIGNVHETPLMEIWESKPYQRLRTRGHCEDCELWPYNLEVKRP